MKKVRIGLIGLGSFAHIARLPVLVELDNIELAACMSRSKEKVKTIAKKYGFQEWFTELTDFINKSNVDAAIVCTPKQTHYEIVMKLLNNGINVFCEKPMAMSIKEAEEMVECAEKNNLILMIGFNRRYAPVYEWAKKEFEDKRPDICIALKNRPGTEYRATMENAIHMVDLMRFFCGECIEIKAYSKFDDPYYETNAAALLRFDEGTFGFLLGNRTCGQWMERVELYGDGKTVIVNCPDSITVIDKERESSIHLTPLNFGWARLIDKMGFKQELEAFIKSLTENEKPRNLASDSIKTHILLNEVLKVAGLPPLEE